MYRCYLLRAAATFNTLSHCPPSFRHGPSRFIVLRLFCSSQNRVSVAMFRPPTGLSDPRSSQFPGAPAVASPSQSTSEEEAEEPSIQKYNPKSQKCSHPRGTLPGEIVLNHRTARVDDTFFQSRSLLYWQSLVVAVNQSDQSGLGDIFEDVLSLPPHTRIPILRHLLSAPKVRNGLSHANFCLLLSSLFSLDPNFTSGFRKRTTFGILHILSLITSPYPPYFESALQQAIPLIDVALGNYQAPADLDATEYSPPMVVRDIFLIMQTMLSLEQKQPVFSILQALLEKGFIPSPALKHIRDDPSDFRRTASLTCATAALYWDWPDVASRFLIPLAPLHPKHNGVRTLSVDSIRRLFVIGDKRKLGYALSIIVRTGAHFQIPDTIIQEFYDVVLQARLPELAEKLFLFTSADNPATNYRYPPPVGAPLPWLMKHLSGPNTRRRYLARLLALQICEKNVPVPPLSRAVFIGDVAANGHAALARELYERYSTGQDRQFVVGSSSLLIRLCSLFSRLSTKLQGGVCQGSYEATPSSQLQRVSEPRHENIDDLANFVNHVLSSYRTSLGDFTEADHHHLTSLARAYFLLGRVSDGFRVFSFMLKRKDLPDQYDITIALGVLAERSPQAAARVMAQMAEKGVPPGNVAYGTVIHQALLHGDDALVDTLLGRMKELGIEPTLKTTASLILSVTSKERLKNRETLPKDLRRVYAMLKELEERNQILPARLGRRLVHTALDAQEPVLGYEFWRMLCSLGAEWNHDAQVRLRGMLFKSLVASGESGVLENEKMKVMTGILCRKSPPLIFPSRGPPLSSE